MAIASVLFPDTRGIESMSGCVLRPGIAVRRDEPVIAPTLPCEGTVCYVYGTVLKHGGWYRIWHQSVIPHFGDVVCHSLSRDGVAWRRPLFNSGRNVRGAHIPTVDTLAFHDEIASWPGQYKEKNNIAACLHNPVVFAPDNGDPYPGEYKIFGFTDKGYVVGFSRDGRRFHYARENPVIPLKWYPNAYTHKSWVNDVGVPFWDAKRNRYVGLIKTYEIDSEGRTRRCIGYTESYDLLHWDLVETTWRPGEAEDKIARSKGHVWADFYGLPAFPYGDGYVGLLWLFLIDSELPKGTNLGRIEVYLAWSEDAKRWKRVSDEPLLALPPDGEWCCGGITTASLPVRERDHEKIYFAGGDAIHGAWEIGMPPLGTHPLSIGLATLPKNGFGRLWASEGTFVTAPLLTESGAAHVTFSAENENAFAEVHKRGDDKPLFAGNVKEGEKIKIPLPRGNPSQLHVKLKNAGVYTITGGRE